MLLRSRHNRAVFMILLRFYVRSYLGGALEVSILVYDQGTYPDGDREVYDSSQLLEINKPEEHLSLPAERHPPYEVVD